MTNHRRGPIVGLPDSITSLLRDPAASRSLGETATPRRVLAINREEDWRRGVELAARVSRGAVTAEDLPIELVVPPHGAFAIRLPVGTLRSATTALNAAPHATQRRLGWIPIPVDATDLPERFWRFIWSQFEGTSEFCAHVHDIDSAENAAREEQQRRQQLGEEAAWLSDHARATDNPVVIRNALLTCLVNQEVATWRQLFADGAYLHFQLQANPRLALTDDFLRRYQIWLNAPRGGRTVPRATRPSIGASRGQIRAHWRTDPPPGDENGTAPTIGIVAGDATFISEMGFLPIAYDPRVLATRSPDERANLYAKSDAIILFGGPDIPACWYNEGFLRGGISLRDAVERELLEYALQNAKPILGICGGMQLLNVVAGGTLLSDIDKRTRDDGGPLPFQHGNCRHPIAIAPNSLLARLLGHGDGAFALEVESAHHQAIDQVGHDLRVSAISPDGIIEAIELPGETPVLGVQFHPDRGVAGWPELLYGFADLVRRGGPVTPGPEIT